MTDITEKLNADRAVRVWAVEMIFSTATQIVVMSNSAGVGTQTMPPTRVLIDQAAKLEAYVTKGATSPAPEPGDEFEEVEPHAE